VSSTPSTARAGADASKPRDNDMGRTSSCAAIALARADGAQSAQEL